MSEHKLKGPISDASVVIAFIFAALLAVGDALLSIYMPRVAVGFAVFMATFTAMCLCSRTERIETYISESEAGDAGGAHEARTR